MKNRWLSTLWGVVAVSVVFVGSISSAAEGWKLQRVHEKFFAEGASAGDLNGDGHLDLVAGPIWFEGPAFEKSHEIAAAREFPISTYSDQFFSHVLDANGDSTADVLVLGFPGKSARLYLNPGRDKLNEHWKMFEIAPIVDNESPRIVDLIPGGLPEIVCGREGLYGYYQATADATTAWKWNPVTRPGVCSGRFAHGLGVGDVNGDGRDDLLDKTFWWEQPEDLTQGSWEQRSWAPGNYGGGGAQIHVEDLDGDGDGDIVTSLNAHGYGLAWFEQRDDGSFEQHSILGSNSVENDFGVTFSQLHAVELADIDQDGLTDIVTGKRWRAHQGKDVGGLQEPLLYWFRQTRSQGKTEFVPHLIDRDSGVGVDVLVQDLNADARPDVVTSSKRGLAIHFQQGDIYASAERRWNSSEGKDQTKYADGLSPVEAAKQMLVPEGFGVDLIAGEPELTQPIAMCFDARGRIWVIEGHTYPTKAPEGEGKDRIVIFEDTDADGQFETKKVFATGVNLASGIEVGFGGVWVGAAPQLLFFPDADHDDQPDSEPQVLLDGWGYQDTHETLNSFTWGPDGWLYGCHGVFTHSNVGKPGASDSERTRINAGVWRYHPTEHRFEVFAHGTSNPWGVDFTDQGEWFLSACVIPHMYHIQQGGRFQRQAGTHFNPNTYDDIKTIADHRHYAGRIQDHAYWGDNKEAKPPAPLGTSLVGGGHAHCGLAIYNGGAFPKQFDGQMFFHNLHGHRLLQEGLQRNGSGFVAVHRPDFALARDHLEIGVGVMVGPDGAIYTSDWHDVQTCHNRETEVWDRTNGRIFRIRYGALQPPAKFDLWSESDAQLVQHLESENGFFARQAQRILQERAAAGSLQISEVVAQLDRIIERSGSQRDRLRAIWTKHGIGSLGQEAISELLQDEDPYVRSWAIHFIGESYPPQDPTIGLAGQAESPKFDFGSFDLRDPHPVVRRYLASLLQRLPLRQRWPVLESLTSFAIDDQDPNIPWLVWYGMEPLVAEDPSRCLALAQNCRWQNLLRFTIRRAAQDERGREVLVSQLIDPTQEVRYLPILEELSAVAKGRAGLDMPAQWPQAYQNLAGSRKPQVVNLARSLSVQFGDSSVWPYFREVLADSERYSPQERLTALQVLRGAKDPQLPELAFELLDDRDLAEEAIAALAQYEHKETPERILSAFSDLESDAKLAALNTLVTRVSTARALVKALEDHQIAAQDVPAFIVRQAVSLEDEGLTRRLEKSWGKISASSEETQALYAKYRKILTAKALDSASAARGRVLYDQNCGQCHKLFGTGGEIGPEITGANRMEVNYWLENILEPNALIGKAYQVTNFLTSDGRVVNGIVQEENEDAITLQTATEKIVLAKEDIETRRLSEVSLMPQGQLEPMAEQQVLDLFHYLMSPGQVAPDRSLLRKPGTRILEGEKLAVRVSGGQARPQAMGGFGQAWSGGEQLWWTGGKVGDKLTVELPTAQMQAEALELQLYLTQAVDYAQVRISPQGQEPQVVDLFAKRVQLAAPVVWKGLKSSQPTKKLEIEILGHNPQAVPSLMLGIDRIELVPQSESP